MFRVITVTVGESLAAFPLRPLPRLRPTLISTPRQSIADARTIHSADRLSELIPTAPILCSTLDETTQALVGMPANANMLRGAAQRADLTSSNGVLQCNLLKCPSLL